MGICQLLAFAGHYNQETSFCTDVGVETYTVCWSWDLHPYIHDRFPSWAQAEWWQPSWCSYIKQCNWLRIYQDKRTTFFCSYTVLLPLSYMYSWEFYLMDKTDNLLLLAWRMNFSEKLVNSFPQIKLLWFPLVSSNSISQVHTALVRACPSKPIFHLFDPALIFGVSITSMGCVIVTAGLYWIIHLLNFSKVTFGCNQN